jgi:hypothetical protein
MATGEAALMVGTGGEVVLAVDLAVDLAFAWL